MDINLCIGFLLGRSCQDFYSWCSFFGVQLHFSSYLLASIHRLTLWLSVFLCKTIALKGARFDFFRWARDRQKKLESDISVDCNLVPNCKYHKTTVLRFLLKLQSTTCNFSIENQKQRLGSGSVHQISHRRKIAKIVSRKIFEVLPWRINKLHPSRS